MGIRLYPNAKLEDLAKFLGYTEKDILRYKETKPEDFNNFTADKVSTLLEHFQLFGFGKFDLRILQANGFSEENIIAGATEDAELAVKLLISTRFYNPLEENAFAWAAFFKLTGGVRWS